MAEAFALAHSSHHGQTRKGTQIPYFTHVMAVAGLVGEYGGNEDQIIAGLLHDAPEDQGGRAMLEAIRVRFGSGVAELVEACSDAFVVPKPPWKERKLRYIAHIPQAPMAARLVVAADKIHNLRSMYSDHRQVGVRLWERFSVSRDDTIWYYEAVYNALRLDWRHPILDELSQSLANLRHCE